MSRRLLSQIRILAGTILANYVAQVIYFLHLYYTPQHPLPDLKSAVLMGAVFALFLIGYALFIKHHRSGFYVLGFYLSLEFLFYLWNLIGGGLHGPGWFFHLSEPDPILWIVFAIGYLNLFTTGYFLFLLVIHRQTWLRAARA